MSSRVLSRAWMQGVMAMAIGAFLVACAMAQEISWLVPEDGGTPRDTNRIERVGPREFRIRAAFEEGGPIVLRHAVSRVDLICRNEGPQTANITIHLDLSGDEQRTD